MRLIIFVETLQNFWNFDITLTLNKTKEYLYNLSESWPTRVLEY